VIRFAAARGVLISRSPVTVRFAAVMTMKRREGA
jgi:hypothetical protein